METFYRTCKKEYSIKAKNGTFTLKKGSRCLTSRAKKGMICVFATFWVWVPTNIFGRPERFT